MRAIDVCRRYVDMQKEYASQPRDAKVGGLYAQKLRSEPRPPGWPVLVRRPEEETPARSASSWTQAAVEGYDVSSRRAAAVLGHYFKILTAQGPAAKGGAKDYIVEWRDVGGFALLAYPAEYGRSGIMSFLVNQDGVVYEADLGEDTLTVAATIAVYNPDAAWTPVKEPKS